MEGIQHLIKTLTSIIKDPSDETAIINLHECIKLAQPEILNNIQPHIYSTYNVIFKHSLKEKCYNEDTKQTITDSIHTLLSKIKIDNIEMFFFLYGFLLNEVYDDNEPTMVKKIHEEYKLSIMRCMKALMEALFWDILLELYTRKHAPKLCQMLYVALEMAKREQFRTLRISSIECIMAIGQVLDLSSEIDLELRNQVADVFMFFIPGISTGLKDIALEDEKSGHMVCLMALRAWGRVVALQMQNYDSSADQKVPDTLAYHISSCSIKEQSEVVSSKKNKWKTNEEVKEYIESSKRTLQWYKEADAKIQPMVKSLSRLTCHSHAAVRLELTDVCSMLIKHCSTAIPLSVSQVVEILVTLSENDDKALSVKARKIITDFSKGCFTDLLKVVGENIQENFYNTILALPRIMNSLDDNQQLAGLNLLLGYLRLFGSTHLSQVLHSTSRLNHLISAIIQICELDNGDIRILEDYIIKDFELEPDCRTPWKTFRYFPNETVAKKIEEICTFLGESGTLTLISGVLQDYFVNDEEHRREITLILNNVLQGCKTSEDINIVRDVINMYLDPDYWNLPLEVSTNEYGENYTLPEIQNNIIQICLQLEGIGRIALAIGNEFEQFLIKSLYPVLEQAGSGNSLVRTAGLAAITNISVACNYQNVTELVNSNADYFSFHVVRKIHRAEHNKSVLNVLAVVMNYSTIDVLESMADIVSGVLLQSCDKFFQDRNANTFLRVFKVFISCLIRWLNIEIVVQPIIPKEQRRFQHFEISGINHDQDFSDAVMGDKTAEEMFKEDMEKQANDNDESSEIDEVDEYKKPEPPMHVKLTVSILRRCQHFLPSKNRDRKMLVLEILKGGFEVIRSWDDELLPLVHQVWSPLVNRFTEFNEPLIINCSFQLLVTMARVSKDFICSRTTKEVLPHIVKVLTDLSKESFLKDKGAAYRYTQSYKLQLTIINNLAAVISDLEMSEKHITECVKAVAPYLNNKQPVPLQESAVKFFVDLAKYDQNLVSTAITSIKNENCIVISASERVNCKRNIEKITELCTTICK